MLKILITGLLISIVNGADPSGTTRYPSGFKDIDKFIFSAPKESKLPLLRLGANIIDSNNKIITAGIYQADISPDKTVINIYQNGEIKGSFVIFKLIERNEPVEIPVVTYSKAPNGIIMLIKQNNFEAYAAARDAN